MEPNNPYLFQETEAGLAHCDELLENRLLDQYEQEPWTELPQLEQEAAIEVVHLAFKIVSTIMTAANTNNIQTAHGRISTLLNDANTLPKI